MGWALFIFLYFFLDKLRFIVHTYAVVNKGEEFRTARKRMIHLAVFFCALIPPVSGRDVPHSNFFVTAEQVGVAIIY